MSSLNAFFKQTKMYLRPRKVLPLLVLGLAVFQSPASFADNGQDGWVEVRSIDDAMASYKERRGTHGFLMGFGMENYKPKKYQSLIDDKTHEELFGSGNIPFGYIELGYKFNFMLGSLSMMLGYSQGNLASADSGQERTILMERNTLRFMYIMDNIMSEPYIAPYASYGIWKIGLDETEPASDVKISGESEMGTMMSVGLLIQLNWIESEVSRRAYIASGLENTYLDLFLAQMGRSNGADDPDFSSEFNFGGGLRIEF